jgi:hypothetical protein
MESNGNYFCLFRRTQGNILSHVCWEPEFWNQQRDSHLSCLIFLIGFRLSFSFGVISKYLFFPVIIYLKVFFSKLYKQLAVGC